MLHNRSSKTVGSVSQLGLGKGARGNMRRNVTGTVSAAQGLYLFRLQRLSRTSRDVHGTSNDFRGLLWTPTDFYGLPGLPWTSNLRTSMDFYGLLWTSRTSRDFCGLPWTSTDFQEFPWTSKTKFLPAFPTSWNSLTCVMLILSLSAEVASGHKHTLLKDSVSNCCIKLRTVPLVLDGTVQPLRNHRSGSVIER